MQRKKKRLALLAGAAALGLLLASCHKKQVPPPAPPATAPAASASAAPACQLTAEPSTIGKGQSSMLSWTSENATDVDLEPGVGKVQANGSTSVSPDDSTTYTLTVKGSAGQNSCQARVTVTATAPPPAPATTPQISESDLFEQDVKDVYFDLNKSDIRPDGQQALNADAEFLKSHPSITFTIEGHCDERGTEEYNLGLGQRRADAAKQYLVNLGVDASRINTISYGKDRPFCTDHTEECWQQNRRDHFVLGSETK